MCPDFTSKTTGQSIIPRISRRDKTLTTLPIKPLETKISNFRATFTTEELLEMRPRRTNRMIFKRMIISEDRKK
jgi:hypothetical protein